MISVCGFKEITNFPYIIKFEHKRSNLLERSIGLFNSLRNCYSTGVYTACFERHVIAVIIHDFKLV